MADYLAAHYARVEYVLGRVEVDCWSLRQIGEALGLSRERVRQLLQQGYLARDGMAPPDLWRWR